MVATIDEGTIHKAINEIRLKQRQRPDKESISNHILTKRGLAMDATLNTIDKMLEAGKIYIKKTPNGEDSFFLSEGAIAKDDIEGGCRSRLQSVDGDPRHSVLDGTSQQSMAPRTTGSESHPVGSFAESTNLLSSVLKMVDSINLLNRLLQEERSKSDDLLAENLSLKLENRALEVRIEQVRSENNGIQSNDLNKRKVNNREQAVVGKTIEIGSELITEAERHLNETDKSQLSNAKVATQKLNEPQNKNKNADINKQDYHQEKTKMVGERNPKDAGKQKKVKKLKVLIVEDSQLRRIDDTKLSNDHRDVEIDCKPGMKIKQAVSKVGKSDKEIIIVHAATNDAKSSAPEQLCKDVVNTLKQIQTNNPKSRIAFSSVIRRNDDQSINAKVRKLNGILEEELAMNGFDIIDNANIQYSNLWKDGLHVNDGGIRKLSGNLSKYIKYC